MKALVLGGPGFVGTATCRELMRRGVETISASRTPKPYGTFTSHVAFDRTDEDELRRVLGEVQPDVLLDLAAYQPADVQAVVRNFTGSRYILTSTGVYPDLFADRPAREEDFAAMSGEVPQEPLEYRDGKRWCETVLARAEGFPWTVIRPPAVVGAGDHRIPAYLARLEDGGPLLVPAEAYRRQLGLAWVKDVGYVHALAADLRRNTGGRAYNVAFEGVTLEDLLVGLGRALGRDVDLVPIPSAELPRSASPYGVDPRRSAGYHLDRARADLGFEPSALADCLAEVLAWWRAERPPAPGYEAERPAELELAAAVRRR